MTGMRTLAVRPCAGRVRIWGSRRPVRARCPPQCALEQRDCLIQATNFLAGRSEVDPVPAGVWVMRAQSLRAL